MVDILPLGSGSVDPHIFADLDPGSQNLSTGLEYDLVNTRRGSAMVQCCSQENDFRDDYTENI